MAAAVESALDQLKSCPRETRRTVFHQLWRDGQIRRNGFTLFQYHVVPAILEEQRGLSPSAVSVHYAEIRAGLRWSYAGEEQENFWRRQTQDLFNGSIAPLQPETFENYLQAHYDAFVETPPELCRDGQEPENEIDLRDLHIQATAQQLVPTPALKAQLHLHETPISNSDIVTPAIEDPRPRFAPPDAPSPPKPVKEDVVPDADLVVEEPANPQVHPPSPIIFPTHKLCPQTVSKSPASRASAIEQKIHILNRLTPGTELWRLRCTSLDPMVDKSGFTLFEYHIKALARRGCQAAIEADTEPGRFSKVWRSMLDHERDEWRVDTMSLKNGLQNIPQKEVLNHFNTKNFSSRLRRYQARIIGSLHAYLRDNSAAPFQFDRTSIVDVLLGTSSTGIEPDVLIHAIHRSLMHRGILDSGLLLRFRCRGILLFYDEQSPGEEDGMKRLRNVAWRGLTPGDAPTGCQDPIMAMNAILKPLVYFNRDRNVFADMEHVEFGDEEIVGYSLDTHKSLKWAHTVIRKMSPLTPALKEPTDSGAESRGEEWSLETNASGLAAKLLRCFDRERLDPRAYEDLMEQTMWAFFQLDAELADRIDPSGRRREKARREARGV
ncbi:uncharacterized protein MYCFIDRAFT_78164 [Pseudocercospora fijiensis CIRAD86]|uniref:Uncharacterized protein n=1 Tax=Pseudocercospora fijiensis (strain CIRAD86) TaxID=383855 RepID=M3A725_PSEFD|nr:uncharacterized protein MYCFIDRAFT_78164 [Pseudocercospora fijiensis CIRAD86]EME80426.1 hypothetical protein MYCFIDRAFT_78164 [Pseudocercospora fijiensis CIRAD86]